MRRAACIASAAVVLGWVQWAAASEIGQEIAGQIDVANYTHYLNDLLYTHSGHNRAYNGAHHDLAQANIESTFQSFGLTVELFAFTYQGQTYYNVIATQPGVTTPEGQYLIGAHYDSVGNAGADDDASGVAAILEIARVISQYDTACTIKYCAWDVEEAGLRGSTAYVAAHNGDDIRAMVQIDMVAHDAGLNRQDLYAGSAPAVAALRNALGAAFPLYGNGLQVQYNGHAGFSDHAPFYNAGYPAVCFVEDNYIANTCYHQPCDHVDQVNYIQYAFACNLARVVAGYLADHAQAMPIDPCAGALPADANCDAGVDFFDIDPFLLALFDLPSYTAAYCGGTISAVDLDASGSVDFFDIDPFLAILFAP